MKPAGNYVKWIVAAVALLGAGAYHADGETGVTGLRAGIAKIDITPAEPVYMGGYSLRNAPSAGVHDKLFTRALVLSDGTNRLVFLISDIIGMTDHAAIRRRIAEATGIPAGYIIAGDVHNHSAPSPGKKNQGTQWIKRYQDSLLLAVRQALATMQPVRMGAGAGASRIAMNRRKRMREVNSPVTFDENYASQSFGEHKTGKPVLLRELEGVVRLGANPLGPIDDEVGVLRIDTRGGKPLAVLVNYACHGTSLGGRNDRICGEWMGRMMAVIEARLPGVQAMFLQGAAGDINPRVVGGLDGYEDSLEKTAALGEEIAAEVLRVHETIQPDASWDPAIRLAHEVFLLPRTYRELFDDYRNTTVEVPTTAARIGDVSWVTFPGEMFHQIGQRVKQASQSKITFIAGYTNGSIGYLPTRAAFAEGGYEPAVSHLDPMAEPLYLRQVADLLQRLR
jgi:hypothetical protein